MGKAVSQFIVTPPAEKAAEIEAAEELFKDHLGRVFPGYDFIVAAGAPFESTDFQVFPMMGYVGDGPRPDGSFSMCEAPDPWILEEIRGACRSFNVSDTKRRLM